MGRGIPKVSSQYTMSPWWRGFYWQYSDADQLWNKWQDRGWIYALGGGLLFLWTKGWYMRHFGTKRCLEMIKRAKHSRRYYGRLFPRCPILQCLCGIRWCYKPLPGK